MASIRNKCTKISNNYNNNNENNILSNKSYAQIFDQTSGNSHTNNCNNNSHTVNGSRPQLRWSQSFSPTDRQKPNVSTLIRRKSAVERLAETKYNYIKSSPTPTVDRDGRERQKLLHKSLSTSALKPSFVILTQSSTLLLTNNSVDCHQNQLNHSNINCQQTMQSSVHPNCPTTTTTSAQTPVVTTRKRNPSLSSRLSEGSTNLEQQLRQLIAESEEQNSDNRLMTSQTKKKFETKVSVIKSANESPVKPKPKERLKTTNQQILRQNTNVVPKQRTIFDKTNDKTIVDNRSVDNKNTSINNCILRYNSSHNNSNNKMSNNLNSKLIIQSKPLTQSLQQKTSPVITITPTIRSISITNPSSRQMSISRSKSDVSNRLLVKRNKSKDEIERFFETLGLDSTVWDSIRSEATNSLISTPAHYFESCDSFESSDVRKAAISASSSSSSSTDRHSTSAQPTVERQTLNTRLMQSRSCHALSSGTSIVEKNARVIKWLYNCRKAMV